jgi:sec-independent protein translocase protein TatB
MFNIGGGELLVIMLIALIVLGPQRLPDAARQVGKTMGDLRRLSQGFQNEMKSALDTADDPNRVAPRRNVLSQDDPAPAGETPTRHRTKPLVADAIASVSAQPSAPAKKAPSAKAAAKKTASTRKTPLKASPAKNGTPVKAGAVKKAPTRPTKT